MTIAVWFRRDLRLQDNPALHHACLQASQQHSTVIAVYLLDDGSELLPALGGTTCWYLHQSLKRLENSLAAIGIRLLCRTGEAAMVWKCLIKDEGVDQVFWNRIYEPGQNLYDQQLLEDLEQQKVTFNQFDDDVLMQPDSVRRNPEEHYRVFTPFWKKVSAQLETEAFFERLLPSPEKISETKPAARSCVENLGLLNGYAWYPKLQQYWQPGEAAVQRQWKEFIQNRISGYGLNRDFPGVNGVSRLSTALHFGEISIARVYRDAADRLLLEDNEATRADIRKFQAELGWREFSRHLLHHYPNADRVSMNAAFDSSGLWVEGAAERYLQAWQQGKTGFTLVDAGMRELWETGYMHNRVRMVVASFLVKNLGVHWRNGAAWFWDTLVDADLANNSLSWQWVAGCGADAAPYFRIFNPQLQAQKFDPDGVYRRRWLGSEVSDVDPIVDLAQSRRDALERYQLIRQKT